MHTTVDHIEVQSKDSSAWYSQLAKCISELCRQGDIKSSDLAEKDFTGMFATAGVTIYLQNRPLEVWSDEPGELIVRHQRAGQGEELIALLKSTFSDI